MRPVRRLRVRRRYRRLSDASNGGAAANESLRKALSAPINGSHRVAASIVHGATGRWNGTGAVPQTVEDEPQARTMRKTSPSLDSTYSSPAPSKPKEVRPATEPGPNHRSLSFTVRLRVGTKLSIHPPQKSPKK